MKMASMNKRSRSVPALLLTVVLMLAGPHAFARDHDRERADGGGVSAEQAAAIVSSAYGGRVVSVKSEGNGYRVRVVLDGGRVKTVLVDSNGHVSESN
jgi:hypothetical protein